MRLWAFVPSVLILRAVLTRAKSVALKVTVPSLLRGMFMPTSRCRAAEKQKSDQAKHWSESYGGEEAPCMRPGEDRICRNQVEVGCGAAESPRPGV